MKPLEEFADIHSHSRRGPDIITNLPLLTVPDTSFGRAWYSAGIHPWETATPLPTTVWDWLAECAADPRVVAIGECGLDTLRGGPMPEQEKVFLAQARIASRGAKPVIIHCVRAWHRLLALRAQLPDNIPMIIHGFRGKPELGRQLRRAGFRLSFGLKYNPQTMSEAQGGIYYRETDA